MSDRLDDFADEAQPRIQLWRFFAGLVLIVTPMVIFGVALLYGLVSLAGPDSIGGDIWTQSSMLSMLSTFFLWWIGLAMALRLLHRRRLSTVLGPPLWGRRRRFARGMAWAAAFFAAEMVIFMGLDVMLIPSRLDFVEWLPGALAGAALLLVQTGAEEAVFRGYMLQQLRARFRSPLAWAVVPSILFGLIHWDPSQPGGGLPTMLATGFGGFILAIVTARTGDLFAAWGVHFGVNCAAILLVAPEAYLSGLALMHVSSETGTEALIWLDIALMAAFAVAALKLIPSPRDD